MTPFALTFAAPCPTRARVPYVYDAGRQVNVLPNGRPAVYDNVIMLGTVTTSTAGSATHNDDTDV